MHSCFSKTFAHTRTNIGSISHAERNSQAWSDSRIWHLFQYYTFWSGEKIHSSLQVQPHHRIHSTSTRTGRMKFPGSHSGHRLQKLTAWICSRNQCSAKLHRQMTEHNKRAHGCKQVATFKGMLTNVGQCLQPSKNHFHRGLLWMPIPVADSNIRQRRCKAHRKYHVGSLNGALTAFKCRTAHPTIFERRGHKMERFCSWLEVNKKRITNITASAHAKALTNPEQLDLLKLAHRAALTCPFHTAMPASCSARFFSKVVSSQNCLQSTNGTCPSWLSFAVHNRTIWT